MASSIIVGFVILLLAVSSFVFLAVRLLARGHHAGVGSGSTGQGLVPSDPDVDDTAGDHDAEACYEFCTKHSLTYGKETRPTCHETCGL